MRFSLRGGTLERSVALSTAALVVVLMGATMLVVLSRVGRTLRSGLEARGEAIARSIGAVATPSLLAYNTAALQIAATRAASNSTVAYIVIHDKEGAPAGKAGNLPEEGVSAPGALRKSEIRTGDTFVVDEGGRRRRVLEVLVPVAVDGVPEPWGAVRVGLGYDLALTELRHIGLQLAGLGALLTTIAAAFGLWIARHTAAPIRSLVRGTEALSAGEMDYRIPVRGAKELRDLARSFNSMMDRLREKAHESREFQRALEVLNRTLESQVRERTRELEESTAQYKTLVDHSPDSILIVQEGRVRFVNRAFCETFGFDGKEALADGFDLSRIFAPASGGVASGRIAAWERGESPGRAEILGRDAGGTPRQLELRGSRIEYQGRSAAECILVDTTESTQLRERLAESEKLGALGELSSGVAHDFNNLLGAVLGRVQLLRRREFPAEVDFDLAIIEKAAQDGRETVRRIQEFSRTRRDRRFEPVDLTEVLRDSLEITRSRWTSDAELRSITIEVTIEAAPVPPILANATEMREVFTNLVLNAIDAMPQGGALRLECHEADGKVVASCSDTGVGMTEEIRQHVFDPFFTTKGTRGMGLGMSVVYGIVTRHEGKIDVRTGVGEGTTYTLEFPAARELPAISGGGGASLPQFVSAGRILVIDDETEIAEIVRDVLGAEGHAVDMATNGADGVRMARLAPYDLVLTDLGMPDMSGWEVAERIRALSPDLPVALVTGWGASLDEEAARARGVAAIVHKPFEIDELLRVASQLLQSRASQS